MDTLSQIVDDMHLQGGAIADLKVSAPWAFRLSTPGLACGHAVAEGGGWLFREGAEPLQLEAGHLVVLPGGQEHILRDSLDSTAPIIDLVVEMERTPDGPIRFGAGGVRTDMLSGYFRFDIHMAKPLVTALPPIIHLKGLGAEPPPWMHFGLLFLSDERSAVRPGHQAIINRAMEILVIEALRGYVDALPEGSGNWLLALRDRSLSNALGAMHRDPGKDWSVPDLAEIACLSRSAFADRFTQIMGQPPMDYLTDHRMRLAMWKLKHTRLSIRQIAEQVGYSSETAFSQAFRRTYGEPPSRMRSDS